MNMHHRIDPPTNIEAEAALLGGVMMNNAAYSVIAETGLEPHHFAEPINQEIFRAIGTLIDAGKSANPITLKSFITIELSGGQTLGQYLAMLVTSAGPVIHAQDFAQAVMIAWVRRDMMGASQKLDIIAMEAQEDFELGESLQAIQSRLTDCLKVIDGKQTEGVSFGAAASTALQTTMDAVSGKKVPGINYKIPALMQLMGPALGGKYIQIGGLTKHAKSSLAQQMSRGAAEEGHPVWYYSGEMDAAEISMREIARETGISVKRQQEGKVTASELEQITMASRSISKLPIEVQDRRLRLDQLCRRVKSFAKQAKRVGMPLIVVDSILHIDRDRATYRMNKVEFSEHVTDTLKALARDIDAPVIGLAQLKKNTVERPNRTKMDVDFYKQLISKRPVAADIYGSVEKDADHVVIVWNSEVVLRSFEPAEGSEAHDAWEEVLRGCENKADIMLALSRSANWPTRRTVQWEGARHHFSFPNDEQRGMF